MTGFDVTLIIGIIWLIVLFIVIKLDGRPDDFDDWLEYIMLSTLGTLMVLLILALIGCLIYGLYIADWHSFFYDKLKFI